MKINKRLPPTSTFHIYFRVDKDFNSKVERISSEISKNYNSEYGVFGKGYVPHLTLYLFAAPLKNTKKMIKEIKKIAQKIDPFVLLVDKLILSYDGWLMIDFKNSSKIAEYHRKVVNSINPLRDGILRKKYRKEKELSRHSEEEIEILKKYGDRHAMGSFHTHLSLAKIENMEDAKRALQNYKNSLVGESVGLISLDFVKVVGDESAGNGRLLFRYKFLS